MSKWWEGRRVTVTGGKGFLGRRVVSLVEEAGAGEVFAFGSGEYDLTRQDQVARMYSDQRPDVVLHLAARVGGIGANRENPGRFFYENAIMGIEMIEQARLNSVERFVQVGTVCSYPKLTRVPFREEDLWEGYPEETNAPYGLAKKALLVQGQAYRAQYGLDFIYLLPVNLYGPGDNFDPASSHVIPAMILKFVSARDEGLDHVELWGDGSPTREFLYVTDAARAVVDAMQPSWGPEPVNVGSSFEISIKDLAGKIAAEVGYDGQIVW